MAIYRLTIDIRSDDPEMTEQKAYALSQDVSKYARSTAMVAAGMSYDRDDTYTAAHIHFGDEGCEFCVDQANDGRE